MPELLLLLVLAALAAPYTAYPLLLRVLAAAGEPRRGGGPVREGVRIEEVSVVLPVRDEAADVESRLADILAQQLEEGRRLVEVLVVSDASLDETDERVAGFPDPRVHLLRVEGRRGKTACQQRGLAEAKGQVVVFTDCGARWEPGSLDRLVKAFEDPEVGCAGGRAVYAEDAGGRAASPLVSAWRRIWDLEHALRRLEGGAAGLVGVTGWLCAVRREGAPRLSSDLFDDLALAIATVAGGRRCVYVPEARARKAASTDLAEDWSRRVRNAVLTLHTLWATRRQWALRAPRLYGLQVLAHKGLRYLTPWLLLSVPLLTWFGLDRSGGTGGSVFWAALALAQGLAALAGSAGLALGALGRRTVLWLPGYFLFLQAALLAGWLHWWLGGTPTGWSPRRAGAPATPSPTRGSGTAPAPVREPGVEAGSGGSQP